MHFVDPIHKARVQLFENGGLTLVTDSKRGWMVGDYPKAEPAAALYNELADLHKRGKHNVPAQLKQRLQGALA